MKGNSRLFIAAMFVFSLVSAPRLNGEILSIQPTVPVDVLDRGSSISFHYQREACLMSMSVGYCFDVYASHSMDMLRGYYAAIYENAGVNARDLIVAIKVRARDFIDNTECNAFVLVACWIEYRNLSLERSVDDYSYDDFKCNRAGYCYNLTYRLMSPHQKFHRNLYLSLRDHIWLLIFGFSLWFMVYARAEDRRVHQSKQENLNKNKSDE